MSDRAAMKEALRLLTKRESGVLRWQVTDACDILRAALAAPRPEPVLPEAITCGMPFVIKHYTADLRPTIKGNGFDGLEIGISREEAEEFVAWVNARIAAPPAAAPSEDVGALRRDAERYRWLLNWLVKTGLLSRERCRIDSPASYNDWWILRKPKVIEAAVEGYGETEDAAIDAAMEDKT